MLQLSVPTICGHVMPVQYSPCCHALPRRFEAAAADPTAAAREPWQRAEPAFFWNRALAAPLLGALSAARCALTFGLHGSTRQCTEASLTYRQASSLATCNHLALSSCPSCPTAPCRGGHGALCAARFLRLCGRDLQPAGGRAWDRISCLCRAGRSRNNLLVQQLGTGAAMQTHTTRLCACLCGSVAPFTDGSTQSTGVQLGDRYRVHTASITLLARRSVHRAGGWGRELGVGRARGLTEPGVVQWVPE